MKALVSRETGKMFATESMAAAAARYADAPMRQAHKNKDPRGYAEFARCWPSIPRTATRRRCSTCRLKRPTLWEMEAELKKFSVPLLVMVGDEDELCLDGSMYLRRTVPTAGLCDHSALRPYHHQRGAGGVQCGAGRIVRSRGSRALAGA